MLRDRGDLLAPMHALVDAYDDVLDDHLQAGGHQPDGAHEARHLAVEGGLMRLAGLALVRDTDEAGLAGIPDDARQAARAAAEADGKDGWKFTLQMPSYLPVLQYADDRDLRARMYRAYATRASELGNPELDNGPLIGRILALRDEEARMLGYRNYAEVSLVPKMADTPEQVLAFLRDLAAKAKPFAEKDLEAAHED